MVDNPFAAPQWKTEAEREEAERNRSQATPQFSPAPPASPTPISEPASVARTESDQVALKASEEKRQADLRALHLRDKDEQAFKEAEAAKEKALKDNEEAAKKAAELAAERLAKQKALDEERQKEAEESDKRIEVKIRERRLLREQQRREILEEARVILKEYGGAEGNIPITSGYWGMMNTFRQLEGELKNDFRATEIRR